MIKSIKTKHYTVFQLIKYSWGSMLIVSLRDELQDAWGLWKSQISIKLILGRCQLNHHLTILRGHGYKLRHSSFRLLRRKAAFSVKLPISWNKLPMEMVDSPTLETFKRLLGVARSSLFPSLPWLPRSFKLHLIWLWGAQKCRCNWPIDWISCLKQVVVVCMAVVETVLTSAFQ